MSEPQETKAVPKTVPKTGPKSEATAPEAPVGELTGKQLKDLKKQEKAAKRAATKESIGIAPINPAAAASKEKQQAKTQTAVKKQITQAQIKPAGSTKKIPPLFSHLDRKESKALKFNPEIANIVHPEILSLFLKFQNYRVVGSTARVLAMLDAFKVLIHDYTTPENTTLQRHLTSYLSHQIDYLKNSRPLSVTMGNAIRWLKQQISVISISMSDVDAKKLICEQIDEFINEKIVITQQVIIDNASLHISNESVVLTYGFSDVLCKLFEHCANVEGKKFTLIVVDSRPLFEGKKLVRELIASNTTANINVHYVLINAISTIMDKVHTVFLGAHAMLSNGRLYSRVGTALIAMCANKRNVPVLVCAESLKFSEKIQLDSVTNNESADWKDLVKISKNAPVKTGFALEQFLQQKKAVAQTPAPVSKKQQQKTPIPEASEDVESLSAYEKRDNLYLLNVLYDLTPPEYIKKVITEMGSLPPSSVPVILREYKAGSV
ncbi:hypothetical protein BABINDRAFT_163571 [Babjeviella inositovora NRRL Y-12698]|uniref:Translation initiation factor eIF2B subunit delta n=1 Tax=Babjeviella inositovora NRRL Y-12698 TaxID=984486 RepID=A0A1E3QJQ4_9ASCO|nr:uncharacterized protein BABINDRAFT_163571 [Babjeviella inositovora NRRL Y-12698]ODQ77302.1 hypothetical protein BABINDRAFT_163571 [Babjeviella inositovora NRRL Y-12698]